MVDGKRQVCRSRDGSGERKRGTTNPTGDDDTANTRPTQRRRSQRSRPLVNLGDLSSSDESTAAGGKFEVPTVEDVISVCYLHDGGEGRESSNTSDETALQWWSATVIGVLRVQQHSEVTCVANISFWPARKQARQTCTMLFLTNGLVIDLNDHVHNRDNTSEWRYVSRVAEGACNGAVQQVDAANATPSLKVGNVVGNAARCNGSSIAARAGNSVARSRSKRSTAQVPMNDRMEELANRVRNMEAELTVLRRGQFTQLEVDIVKEVRVETKLGVIDALRRSPGPLHVTDGGQELEAVIQGGTIRWSYKCSMERYKLLAAAVYDFFCDGINKKPSAVNFSPSFDKLDRVCGFGSSEITFATAMDLLRFLGVTNTDDMIKLVNFAYDATGGKHLRVLGSLQDGWEAELPTLSMFVGHSSARDSAFLPPTWFDEQVNPTNKGHADNVFFANASWDSDNSCFAAQPTLRRTCTGYNEVASTECTCFKMKWESEPPKRQRTVSHMTVDSEGVRRGTLVVEMPFYRLAPHLASVFTELWEEDKLRPVTHITT